MDDNYMYIRAFHKWVHGDDTTGLDEVIDLAVKTQAPDDAAFFNDSLGEWATMSNITNISTLHHVEQTYREMMGLPQINYIEDVGSSNFSVSTDSVVASCEDD